MDQLPEFFHLEHDDYLFGVEIYRIQAWPVVAPYSKFYTVSILLFQKNGGAKFSVTSYMSPFICLSQPRPI